MGLFKKKYSKNVTRDNEFMKEYAIKVNGLSIFVEDNEKVKKELDLLKDDLMYTVASEDPKAKSYEKKIKNDFEKLSEMLKQSSWDEDEVVLLTKEIRRNIVEISSLR